MFNYLFVYQIHLKGVSKALKDIFTKATVKQSINSQISGLLHFVRNDDITAF